MNGIPLFEQGDARDALKKSAARPRFPLSCLKTWWKPRSSKSANFGSAACVSVSTNSLSQTLARKAQTDRGTEEPVRSNSATGRLTPMASSTSRSPRKTRT